MCLIITLLFSALAYTFYQDENMQGFYINTSIAFFFAILLIRNILKTLKDKNIKSK
ncbi:protein YpmT [Arcobacter roscoffensis]|uniref:protein YpmT n=1 Tax=Arcobacter roscoffensis TaxID=2961520 RepID=UPI003D233CB5